MCAVDDVQTVILANQYTVQLKFNYHSITLIFQMKTTLLCEYFIFWLLCNGSVKNYILIVPVQKATHEQKTQTLRSMHHK